MSKTLKKKKTESKGEEYIQATLIKNLMQTVEYEYVLFMKKCYVLKEMENANNLLKFKKNRIRLRIPKREIPKYGTICKLVYPKKEYIDNVKKKI